MFSSCFQLFLCSKPFSQISGQFCLPFPLSHKYIKSSQLIFFPLISVFHLSFIKLPFFFIPSLALMLISFLNTRAPCQCFTLYSSSSYMFCSLSFVGFLHLFISLFLFYSYTWLIMLGFSFYTDSVKSFLPSLFFFIFFPWPSSCVVSSVFM